ncbi:MAG: hypothetical protein HPY74_08570 [Firmicutes bacterium]|nr:hypothetical protein [Bacillota bacterium]
MSNEEKMLNILLTMQADMDSIKSDVSSLKDGQIRLEEKLVSVEERLGSVEGRLESVEGRLESVEKRLDSVEEKLNSIYEQTAILTEFRTEVLQKFEEIDNTLRSVAEITGSHEIQLRNIRRMVI